MLLSIIRGFLGLAMGTLMAYPLLRLVNAEAYVMELLEGKGADGRNEEASEDEDLRKGSGEGDMKSHSNSEDESRNGHVVIDIEDTISAHKQGPDSADGTEKPACLEFRCGSEVKLEDEALSEQQQEILKCHRWTPALAILVGCSSRWRCSLWVPGTIG